MNHFLRREYYNIPKEKVKLEAQKHFLQYI